MQLCHTGDILIIFIKMKRNPIHILLIGFFLSALSSCSITMEYTTYYIFINEPMIRAKYLAMNDDWYGAAEIWSVLANSKNNTIAGKATYNMVLACEMMDRRDLAIEWAKMAAYDCNSKRANLRALGYFENMENTKHDIYALYPFLK